jgi:hypothetical protein
MQTDSPADSVAPIFWLRQSSVTGTIARLLLVLSPSRKGSTPALERAPGRHPGAETNDQGMRTCQHLQTHSEQGYPKEPPGGPWRAPAPGTPPETCEPGLPNSRRLQGHELRHPAEPASCGTPGQPPPTESLPAAQKPSSDRNGRERVSSDSLRDEVAGFPVRLADHQANGVIASGNAASLRCNQRFPGLGLAALARRGWRATS